MKPFPQCVSLSLIQESWGDIFEKLDFGVWDVNEDISVIDRRDLRRLL